tara:strand:- start:676 stop:1125 length:450 start_codon:yes stop_codon:yes gene_type:complete
LRITLLVAGDKSKGWVSSAFEDYAKRMPAHMPLELIEVPILKKHSPAQQAQRMLKLIKPADWVVALDQRGGQLMSADFASKLEKWRMTGINIVVLVGSADGLHTLCLDRANEMISLSKLTFPHQLVRVIFAEQLYRAWSIISDHPYHRV